MGIQNPTGGSSSMTFHGCKVRNTTDQGITPGGTENVLSWDTDIFDTDNIHSTSSNTSRFTIPTGYTKARVKAHIVGNITVSVSQTNTMYLKKNGATIANPGEITAFIAPTTAAAVAHLDTVIEVAANDYIEVAVVVGSSGFTLTDHNNSWAYVELIP